VTDQHHSAFEFVERHAERFACGQVEVVGRLVEQQQVRALPHDHAQHEPRLFAAAHRADRLMDHVATEIEGAKEGAKGLFGSTLAGGAHVSRRAFARRIMCSIGVSSGRSTSSSCCAKQPIFRPLPR
jgi:hypothetical protein